MRTLSSGHGTLPGPLHVTVHFRAIAADRRLVKARRADRLGRRRKTLEEVIGFIRLVHKLNAAEVVVRETRVSGEQLTIRVRSAA